MLIQHCLSSIPIFYMSHRLIPVAVINSIEEIFSRFWWRGTSDLKKGLCLMSWSNICLPKCLGGLGFRNLHYLNEAIVMKQFWSLLNQEHNYQNNIWASIIFRKYLQKKCLWDVDVVSNASWHWKCILKIRNHFINNVVKSPGSGSSIHIWKDPWIANLPKFRLGSSCPLISFTTIDKLISKYPRPNWNIDFMLEIGFTTDIIKLIQLMPINITCINDNYLWLKNNKGLFAIKSAYGHILQHNRGIISDTCNAGFKWSLFWKKHPKFPKHKLLLWKILHNDVPVRHSESLTHLFLSCPYSSLCFYYCLRIMTANYQSMNAFIAHIFSLNNPLLLEQCAWILYNLWNDRNNIIFKERNFTLSSIFHFRE